MLYISLYIFWNYKTMPGTYWEKDKHLIDFGADCTLLVWLKHRLYTYYIVCIVLMFIYIRILNIWMMLQVCTSSGWIVCELSKQFYLGTSVFEHIIQRHWTIMGRTQFEINVIFSRGMRFTYQPLCINE